MAGEYVLARIQAIQQELEELKKTVAYQIESSESKIKKTKLKGLWKGVNVTEEDIEAALCYAVEPK